MKSSIVIRLPVLGVLAALVMSGCSYPISAHLRDEAKNISISMAANNPGQYKDDIIIWGGKIIGTHVFRSGTQIYVVDLPLDYMGRPEEGETTGGRFIAITKGFLDPALYNAGKEVTVAGSVVDVQSNPVGKHDYLYPVVEIKEIHLWKPDTKYIYSGGWDPYWYGPGFYGPDHYYNDFGFYNVGEGAEVDQYRR
jgi:outer membrane lipoprotein